MNLVFAAGLFDQPWLVAVVVIVGALINWLSQRRQEKQQRKEQQHSPGAASESPPKAEGAFDVEEALRRLLGEEPLKPTPAPPPIPQTVVNRQPPPPVRRGNVSAPVLVPPLIAVAVPTVASVRISDTTEQAALRLARADEQVQHSLVGGLHRGTARSGNRNSRWRDRSSMRRAFVGSLVFGPPKGLES